MRDKDNDVCELKAHDGEGICANDDKTMKITHHSVKMGAK